MSCEQRSVVQAFVDGRDVFVCLPIRSGNLPGSPCATGYSPEYLTGYEGQTDSIVVVVSPLKALMRE